MMQPLHFLRRAGRVLCHAAINLARNDGVEMAGYLTFLTLLSLFPFIVLIVAAFGFIGQGETGAQFIHFLFEHLPADVMHSIAPRIDEITSGPPQGLLTVAIVGAIWTSSSAVEGIRTVLNRAYRVGEPPHFFFRRLVSIGQVLVFTLLIILTMLIMVLAPVAFKTFMKFTGLSIPLSIEHLFVDDFVYIGALVLFAGVASLYYVLPNVKQHWRVVMPGAALVVALWIVGTSGVGFYLKNIGSVNVIYGSLSSLIATLIFFFVMNVIFIYGAEFNHVLAKALGDRLVEKEKGGKSPDGQTIRNPRLDGFSLVELSIVLVILGLLTGGILAGQSLIRGAELRSYVSDMQRYTAAIQSFRGKYFQFPGDLNNATSFWGSLGGTGSDATCQNTPATAGSTATCNGNGDGWASGSIVAYDERFRFWQHLANAGLIEGTYTGATDGAAGTFINTAGKNTPALKGAATVTIWDTSSAPTYASGGFIFPGQPAGHYLEFRAASSGAQPLTPEETWNIDTKLDDGKPGYGAIVAAINSWSSSPGCTTTDDASTAAYSLDNSSKICRFNYRYD